MVSSTEQKVGAVMVVGGGIAGMQASLDLADSGMQVYMVEAAPCIGGKMAQLDKTFPTNDCAMCTMAPKLVECGRHLNIQIMSTSELVELRGEAGNFTAVVRHKPRYVDVNKCTACGDCAAKCPVTLPNAFNEGLGTRTAIYKLYPQGVPNAYAIDKKGTGPCKDACPAGCNPQGYMMLVKERRYADAYRLIREALPFPGICGRICSRFCEEKCNRALLDGPVAAMHVKRFVTDWTITNRTPEQLPRPAERRYDEKVAVVGAGPAGMTAALDLTRLGYGVTVLEALPCAGGMMRYGIPEYRLPREVIQQEVDDILAEGVELRCNTRVDSVDELLAQGYQAVFLSIGSHKSNRLEIPGEDLPGVLKAVDFLRTVSLGEKVQVGPRVVVVGGGFTAVDAARTSLRLGASQVDMVYRRSRVEMGAHPEEIADMEREGGTLHILAGPVRVIERAGRAAGVEFVRMQLGEPDARGRRRPVPIPGSEFAIECDTVIAAIGQGPESSFLADAEGIEVGRGGTVAVDQETLATGRPGVFAGGDLVTGAGYVVQAIASGHQAAQSIHRHLRGLELRQPAAVTAPAVKMSQAELLTRELSGGLKRTPPRPMPERQPEERVRDFGEVYLGYDEATAIAEAERCLSCGICSECRECELACQAKAINHDDQERLEEVQVGAVVLATGYQLFDARLREEYGLGRYPNVVSSMQFERILSASGPTTGHIVRPSDHQEPKRIAWLQCVGSRDQENKYCSSVCCMYATKEAILTKEHAPATDCSVFLMDMRSFSKGYTGYFERARDRYGVNYIRCRASALKEDPATHEILMRYQTEDGQIVTERFDMAVLSAGITQNAATRQMATDLGVEVDEYGFVRTPAFQPLDTTREGVFVCGALAAPKDIPETVMQASGAAAQCLALLSDVRGTRVRDKEYPPERDISQEELRVGVFICHCGSNIAGVVDVQNVAAYIRTLPNVVHVETNLYTCADDSLHRLKDQIREKGINRVIVSSCTPRTHEPLFQETIREVGLNPFLFEMANIRDQCSWVHGNDHHAATEKAKELVRMAVARARLLEPLSKQSLSLSHRALVLGGGVAGMTSALDLGRMGFPVTLVEREKDLGGWLRHSYTTVDGRDTRAFLRTLIEQVQNQPNIDVLTETAMVKSGGFLGNFKSTVRQATKFGTFDVEVEHGVTVVATGSREYRGQEYFLGEDTRVLTQGDLEQVLHEQPAKVVEAKSIVMLQCVKPPDGQNYCSRTCCADAVKNALKVKEINPSARVYVLYKDMVTYGFLEKHYTAAREKGVIFIRYKEGDEPQARVENGQLVVETYEMILGRRIVLRPDLLVLSTAILPAEGAHEISEALKVHLGLDGFFLEAHVKLRPVDLGSDGIFVAGTAHYPKTLEESIAHATASAGRAATILTRERLSVGGAVAHVDPDKCAACLTCVRVCPYNVPFINEKGVAEIQVASCQGCGTCAGECPAKAVQLMHYRDAQMLAKTEALLQDLLDLSSESQELAPA
ncbi:MAG: FAD-dependent oxidoreductase [Chloroflexi bacterium]|nr:FAD-dependent oxidoreductase [Chloroflexota bacterium]MCL5110811.1 FAD-dependent oxidoreductase [Chloroflexota bacterium]